MSEFSWDSSVVDEPETRQPDEPEARERPEPAAAPETLALRHPQRTPDSPISRRRSLRLCGPAWPAVPDQQPGFGGCFLACCWTAALSSRTTRFGMPGLSST